MKEIVIAISKYLIIFLMAIYTYESFQAIKMRDNDPGKTKKYCFKQSVFFYIIHFLCFLSLYLHTFQDKIVIFYGALLIYFILLSEINKLLYKNANIQLINIMSMMMMLGFTMLTRLSFQKAIKQFIICIIVTFIAFFLTPIMRKVKTVRNYSYLYAILGIGLLCAVYAIGKVSYGAKLSLDFKFFTIQPSELVKLTYVVFISGILYKSKTWKSIILSAILAGMHVIILVLSSDLGAALILSIIYIFMLYVATGKSSFLFGGLIVGSGAAFTAYKLFSHVKVRVAAWLNPWSIIDDKGYQITQSLFAIGTGGLFGMGLYEGMPNSIPVVDQDFIFSAISEEFGALVAICVILLSINVFMVFIRTALSCKDEFYKLICCGLAISYGIQTFLTIGGAIKLIPSTGVTYPLISYGGSSLMATIFMFFIIQGVKIIEDEQ